MKTFSPTLLRRLCVLIWYSLFGLLFLSLILNASGAPEFARICYLILAPLMILYFVLNAKVKKAHSRAVALQEAKMLEQCENTYRKLKNLYQKNLRTNRANEKQLRYNKQLISRYERLVAKNEKILKRTEHELRSNEQILDYNQQTLLEIQDRLEQNEKVVKRYEDLVTENKMIMEKNEEILQNIEQVMIHNERVLQEIKKASEESGISLSSTHNPEPDSTKRESKSKNRIYLDLLISIIIDKPKS